MNLALRLARREMRSGLAGFRLFIACLALGVGAIAAILSFSRAVEEGLHADAREILGGDVAISLLYREATPEQVDYLRKQGQVARWIDSRAMARPVAADGRPALIQLKAVEGAYPNDQYRRMFFVRSDAQLTDHQTLFARWGWERDNLMCQSCGGNAANEIVCRCWNQCGVHTSGFDMHFLGGLYGDTEVTAQCEAQCIKAGTQVCRACRNSKRYRPAHEPLQSGV